MSIRQLTKHVLASLLAASCASASFAAEATAQREVQMTAAYVFNFTKFVEWPALAADDVLHVCFVGAEHVREALASAAAGKRAGSRRIAVQSIGGNKPHDHCEVIYVEERLEHELPRLNTAGALTIGEGRGFTGGGGIIRLYTESNRLRFIINVANARRAGLTVSSNLLQLATQIEQGTKQ